MVSARAPHDPTPRRRGGRLGELLDHDDVRGAGLKETAVVLLGFGRVGQALAALLETKLGSAGEESRPKLVGIFDRSGGVVGDHLPVAAIVVAKRASGSVASAPGGRTGLPASEAIARYGDAILVDASPTNPQTGEPGLSLVRHALERGHSAVLASKGPLVVAFAELVALARNKGCRIGMSAAVGTPLPSLELVHLGLRGSVLRGFRGVFSATANRILAKMEEGASHQEAMADAERAGILEADPRLDLEGWDTAFKTLILARSFWRPDIPAESMEVQGITGITEADIARNRESGHRLRLIGTARQSSSGEVTIRVEAERLPPTDPFYALGPSEKGAEFESDRMGSLFIRSSQAGPEATAAALAKDILNIAAHPDALAL